ncbi:hypothetical protein Tco_0139592 [Tanacetum coccineum]
MDSILEDSVDENSLNDKLDETISEIFTDEHALDYSAPPLWDDYDDNLFDLGLDNDNCDSVFYEDFSEVDALPSTNNEDKIFKTVYTHVMKTTFESPTVQHRIRMQFPDFEASRAAVYVLRSQEIHILKLHWNPIFQILST